MIALADTHVHLLAGLDDGPTSVAEAVAMARRLVDQGVTHATALAHQNPDYPANTPARLLDAATRLAAELQARDVPLSVYPCGEVMLGPTTFADWKAERLLTVGHHRRHLLVEMPHGLFLDVRPLADLLRPNGLRLVIAHAERYPELLDDRGLSAEWIAAGCLLQVTASAFAEPPDNWTERRLRRWAADGFVHLLGSDGHDLHRRPPVLASGFRRFSRWAGRAAAERAGGLWATAVLQGRPFEVPPPRVPSSRWFSRLFGG